MSREPVREEIGATRPATIHFKATNMATAPAVTRNFPVVHGNFPLA